MQVKVIMPPGDGIMRKTPTGRAVGRNVAWHNFLCCSKICYALGQFYRNPPVTEKSRMFHSDCCQENILDPVFLFRYYENFSSPLIPLVSAVVTWMFWCRQGKYRIIVVFENQSNYFKITLIAHANHQLGFLQLYHSLVRFRK